MLAKLLTVDGAGSGLDADTVDGLHASSFLQASLFTAAQILSRLITVDGSGSGLDADLLDGQHGSFYQSAEPASLGFFPFSPIPSTYLIADGSAVSRTTEARIFARIGTTYGTGNGTTTFNLPNYCGEFLRGWDNGRGVDADRALGSHQMDAMQELKGRIAGMGRGNFAASGNTGVFGGQGQGAANHSDGTNISARANLDFDASLVARTANETRPRNVSVIIGIRR